MIRAFLTFLAVLCALPALATPHLSTSGTHVLWSDSTEAILSGYNGDYNYPGGTQNTLAHDVAIVIAQGGNSVRFRLPFINQPAAPMASDCGQPLYPTLTDEDAYNPNDTTTGGIDPNWVNSTMAVFDNADADVAAAGISNFAITFAFVGGNCKENFDPAGQGPAFTAANQTAWAYMLSLINARHYQHIHFLFEIEAEPIAFITTETPPFDETNVQNFQRAIISTIRTSNPSDAVLIGCAPNYNLLYANACFLSGISNAIYTSDIYYPPQYINQKNPYSIPPETAVFPYPNTVNAMDVPPGGGSFPPLCTYPYQGQPGVSNFAVVADSFHLNAGALSCLLQMRDTNNVPIQVQQFGCKMILTGCLQWHQDIIFWAHENGVGMDKWKLRQACPAGPNCGPGYTFGGGNAVLWQDAAGDWNTDYPLQTVIDQLFVWTAESFGRRP